MGWFTRNKVKKARTNSDPTTTSPSPPNIYTSRPPPPSKPPSKPPSQAPPSNPPPRPIPTNNNRPVPQPPSYRQFQPQPQPIQPNLLQPPQGNYPYGNRWAAQSQPRFQPAGYLPPPPGWNPQPQYHQPVIVNQHFHMGGQSMPEQRPYHHSSLGKFSQSMVNLAKDVVHPQTVNEIHQLYDDGLSAWHGSYTCNQLSHSTAAMYDQVESRFNNVMTLIDTEMYTGNEKDLFNFQPVTPPQAQSPPATTDRAFGKPKKSSKNKLPKHKGSANNIGSGVVSGSYFSKVELYANSKLPRDLPPLSLYETSHLFLKVNRLIPDSYIPTWPIVCLAAQYSQRVYDNPRGAERDAHVSSDWRTGTKAMCIKSVPMDHMNTIVFAIRGTATFMDWAVNLNMAPVSPGRFLDDPGNLCHAGFLSVAKKMVRPVAARLRQLLEQDPSRASYSLLITGHSAGGAVAALLYSHMLSVSRQAESELNILAGCFKRIHCVTFGTPPVSLLPLGKPDRPNLRKSLFLSFINEGDPVVRADKAYVRSLLELLASPPPLLPSPPTKPTKSNSRPRKSSKPSSRSSSKPPARPIWKVPPSTLSNAGRLIVLRSGDPKARIKDRKTVEERLHEGVSAVTCLDEQLRGVIWGDPVCHLMSLYAGRVEVLAVGEVTGKRR